MAENEDTYSSETSKYMSVRIRVGQVRTRPSFLGKVIGSLDFGDRVQVHTIKKGWAEISLPGGGADRGWMHLSSLTTKKIIFAAGSTNVTKSASGEELALAGKGFNSEVEQEFKAKHKDIDYTWIDKMEGFTVPVEELAAFIKEGLLAPGGEG